LLLRDRGFEPQSGCGCVTTSCLHPCRLPPFTTQYKLLPVTPCGWERNRWPGGQHCHQRQVCTSVYTTHLLAVCPEIGGQHRPPYGPYLSHLDLTSHLFLLGNITVISTAICGLWLQMSCRSVICLPPVCLFLCACVSVCLSTCLSVGWPPP